MVAEDLRLEVSRIHKLDGSGATKAFCDLSIFDSFVIKGLRVVEGENGLFVSMPAEAGKDGKWYKTVIPLNKGVMDEVEKLVLEAYGG
ncbi:MAG: SpoVG family protein [Candidatus Omnitrophota bacterium]|jgi:stage V sporulation protein G|nr:SpoVG family protein [Candidatus Omnitrophota bacterium]